MTGPLSQPSRLSVTWERVKVALSALFLVMTVLTVAT
jgi:hypothetical protein